IPFAVRRTQCLGFQQWRKETAVVRLPLAIALRAMPLNHIPSNRSGLLCGLDAVKHILYSTASSALEPRLLGYGSLVGVDHDASFRTGHELGKVTPHFDQTKIPRSFAVPCFCAGNIVRGG